MESENSMASLMALAGCPRKAPVTRVSVYDLEKKSVLIVKGKESFEFSL